MTQELSAHVALPIPSSATASATTISTPQTITSAPPATASTSSTPPSPSNVCAEHILNPTAREAKAKGSRVRHDRKTSPAAPERKRAPCPFANVGCAATLTDEEVAAHMSGGVSDHLLLAVAHFERKRKEDQVKFAVIGDLLRLCLPSGILAAPSDGKAEAPTSGSEVFTTSGEFKAPAGAASLRVLVVGAGGRSFGDALCGGCGGGSGEVVVREIPCPPAGSVVRVVVGEAPDKPYRPHSSASWFGSIVAAPGTPGTDEKGGTGGSGGVEKGKCGGANGHLGQGVGAWPLHLFCRRKVTPGFAGTSGGAGVCIDDAPSRGSYGAGGGINGHCEDFGPQSGVVYVEW